MASRQNLRYLKEIRIVRDQITLQFNEKLLMEIDKKLSEIIQVKAKITLPKQ